MKLNFWGPRREGWEAWHLSDLRAMDRRLTATGLLRLALASKLETVSVYVWVIAWRISTESCESRQ